MSWQHLVAGSMRFAASAGGTSGSLGSFPQQLTSAKSEIVIKRPYAAA